MGFFTKGAVTAQTFGDALGGAIPTGGNTDPALPEAGAPQVVAGLADGVRPGAIEQHVYAAGRAHADRVPALIGDAHTGLIQRHRHQLLSILLVPGGQQAVAQHRSP
ncbi:hypothetical protein D3C84_817070 [compost metagenome]